MSIPTPEQSNGNRMPSDPTAAGAALYSQELIDHLDGVSDADWPKDRAHVMEHIGALTYLFVGVTREYEKATGKPNSLEGSGLEDMFD